MKSNMWIRREKPMWDRKAIPRHSKRLLEAAKWWRAQAIALAPKDWPGAWSSTAVHHDEAIKDAEAELKRGVEYAERRDRAACEGSGNPRDGHRGAEQVRPILEGEEGVQEGQG